MYFVHCAVVSTTAQWTIYYCTVDSCIPMDCLPGSDRWSQPTALLGYPAALKEPTLSSHLITKTQQFESIYISKRLFETLVSHETIFCCSRQQWSCTALWQTHPVTSMRVHVFSACLAWGPHPWQGLPHCWGQQWRVLACWPSSETFLPLFFLWRTQFLSKSCHLPEFWKITEKSNSAEILLSLLKTTLQ